MQVEIRPVKPGRRKLDQNPGGAFHERLGKGSCTPDLCILPRRRTARLPPPPPASPCPATTAIYLPFTWMEILVMCHPHPLLFPGQPHEWQYYIEVRCAGEYILDISMMRIPCFPFILTVMVSASCVQGILLGSECLRRTRSCLYSQQPRCLLWPQTNSLCSHFVQSLIQNFPFPFSDSSPSAINFPEGKKDEGNWQWGHSGWSSFW